jgi:hypothetical protein
MYNKLPREIKTIKSLSIHLLQNYVNSWSENVISHWMIIKRKSGNVKLFDVIFIVLKAQSAKLNYY